MRKVERIEKSTARCSKKCAWAQGPAADGTYAAQEAAMESSSCIASLDNPVKTDTVSSSSLVFSSNARASLVLQDVVRA